MRLWSKGLGKLILPFEVDKAESVSEYNDEGEKVILIQGRIIEKKVNWPYKIYLGVDDMVRFIALMAKSNVVLGYIKSHYGYKFITFIMLLMLKAIFLYMPVVVLSKLANFFKGIFRKESGKWEVAEYKVGNYGVENEGTGKEMQLGR